MLHEYLNTKDRTLIHDWNWFYENYTNIHVEGCKNRCLLRKKRFDNTKAFLSQLARAYKTAQRQYNQWRNDVWIPLFDQLKSLAVDGVTKFHAKPTHEYRMYLDHDWWEYDLSESSPFGWGYSFSWISEPDQKLHHELGQKFYHLDQYQKKFSSREYTLEKILKQQLLDYVYELYNHEWLVQNQFSGKIIKIELQDDEYWYHIGMRNNGTPMWENFIWQSNDTEILKIK